MKASKTQCGKPEVGSKDRRLAGKTGARLAATPPGMMEKAKEKERCEAAKPLEFNL